MRLKVLFAALPVLALFVPAWLTALAGGRLYVSASTGSDSYDCRTARFPCRTVTHAISLSTAGDTLIVASGLYTENLTIPFSLNVVGADAGSTIVDGSMANTVVTISDPGSRVGLRRVTIRNGQTNGDGGGVFNNGTLAIVNSRVIGNASTAGNGGGIYNTGTLIISYSSVESNHANFGRGGGGGIYNATGGVVKIDHTTINRNGTIYGSGGGGIYNAEGSRLKVAETTFDSNSDEKGGGGAIYGGGNSTVVNSTFSANFASWGGGVYIDGVAAFANDTFGGNSATYAGGGLYNAGSAVVQNTILANSLHGGNCFDKAMLTSNGYNLSSDGTCHLNHEGDLQRLNPRLGPLQDNGGPTLTMALEPGSPAINAGNPAPNDGKGTHCKATDQRGRLRTDRCDIGAYEYP